MDPKKLIWIAIGLIVILFVGIMAVRKVKFNPKLQENIERMHRGLE